MAEEKHPYSDPSKYRTRELVVEDVSFFVHPAFLAERSKYFEVLFESNFKEKNEEKIEIKDENASDFLLFLNSLGANPDSDREPVRGTSLATLIRLADKFDNPVLRRRCQEFIKSYKMKDVSLEDSISSLKIALEMRSTKALLTVIIKRIASFSLETLRTSTLFNQISDTKIVMAVSELRGATHGLNFTKIYYVGSQVCIECKQNCECLHCGFCQRYLCGCCYSKICLKRYRDILPLLAHFPDEL